MGSDCVPYKEYCVGEVVYCAGAIEGTGMANSVAIVTMGAWFRCKYYSNELVAKVIRAVGESGRWFATMFSLGGVCSSPNADGSDRRNKDNKDESKGTRGPMIAARQQQTP